MNRINDLKDETIKTLAQTLKESGLAASETEAIRMANNMAQTNKKANDTFEERKEKNIMGLSFLHKEKSEKKPHEEIKEEVVFAEESPEVEEGCASCHDCKGHEDISDKPLNELFETETKDEFITQDLIKEEPEKTQEIPVEKKEPKKDLSEYKEAQVDLGDMFKFKG